MPQVCIPSGDVTLMFTDIEGSTQKWEQHREQFQPALDCHNALLREAIAAYNGYEVKTIGDSFMVAFDDPLDGVACALEMQRRVESEKFPTVGALRVRIGLHSGTLEPSGGDYFGPPVNRAARIESAAHGGMILLSDELAERVASCLPPNATLHDLGLHTLKDLGTQRLFQLTHPDLPERDYPNIRTLSVTPNNFPAEVTTFVGRESDIRTLRYQLGMEHKRLITLTGPGGTGKTRLAMQVAADSIQFYEDGVWMIDLAGVASVRDVPAAVAVALRIELTDAGGDVARQVIDSLRHKKALLLLDNFEQVIDAARFVSQILAQCPGVVCLVTSRQLLQIAGEQEYVVEPLGLPPPHVTLENALNFASVRLFMERALAARPGFALTLETLPAAAELCHRLEGIPLAIELTASLIRGMTPQQLLPRLHQRLKLLTSTRRDLEPRQRSLRGAIDWSYELLTEEERDLFARLAVFSGGFFLDDVEAVCDAPDAFLLIMSLRDKSLLKATTVEGEDRYAMLETLREYAREKLEATGELETLCQRHAEHFLHRADEWRTQLEAGDSAQAMRHFRLEISNLRAVRDWFVQQDDCDRIPQYAIRLYRYLDREVLRDEALENFTLAENACRRQEGNRKATEALAQLQLQRGLFAFHKQQVQEALRLYEDSLNLFRGLNDRANEMKVLLNIGNLAWGEGDFTTSRARYEEGLQYSVEVGETRYRPYLQANIGILDTLQGRFDSAKARFEEALALHRKNKNQRGEAFALMYPYDMYRMQKNFDMAIQHLQESHTLFVSLGMKHETALNRIYLAETLFEAGRLEEAEAQLAQGLQLANEIDDPWSKMYGFGTLGRIAGDRGELDASADNYRRSAILAKSINDRQQLAILLKYSGQTLIKNARYKTAGRVLKRAQRSLAELGMSHAEKEVIQWLTKIQAAVIEENVSTITSEKASPAVRF